jgi:FixJ family two-component response regulator
MQHGAFDFLKSPSVIRISSRAQRALERETSIRTQLRATDRIRERVAALTPREREVLTLVTTGTPNKVVAGDLGVSQRTIDIHRSRVMEKMQAHSLAQLVRMTMDLDRPMT